MTRRTGFWQEWMNGADYDRLKRFLLVEEVQWCGDGKCDYWEDLWFGQTHWIPTFGNLATSIAGDLINDGVGCWGGMDLNVSMRFEGRARKEQLGSSWWEGAKSSSHVADVWMGRGINMDSQMWEVLVYISRTNRIRCCSEQKWRQFGINRVSGHSLVYATVDFALCKEY